MKISRAFAQKELNDHPALVASVERVQTAGSTIHLLGLCSDGGVHSHLDHWLGMIAVLKEAGVASVVLHLMSDGRDTDPHSLL